VLALALASTALALGACGGDGNGSKAHALGEEAPVGYGERDDKGAYTGVRTTIGLTVLAVRKGTQEELKEHGFEVDAEARDTTPYYVDARFENQGDQPVKRNLDVSLEDADGNLIGRTLVFNYGNKPYKPCTEVTEGTLKPGESYESCTLFLVKEGVEVGKVSYLSDNGPDKEPEFVYWESE
jgi:hypothetical protein